MGAVTALRPNEVFADCEWRAVTRVSSWRGLVLVAHAWAMILLAIGLALWIGWLAYIPAIFLIGGRQLGLAILMHDGAHGALHPNRRVNNFVGQWLCGAPVGSDLKSYRTYHLTHHRFTQQPEDPDLSLSKPFPTTRASLRRKFLRDLTGQTFVKQRGAQFRAAIYGFTVLTRKERDTELSKRDKAATEQTYTVGRFLFTNVILLALSLLTWGWTPFLLWFIAMASSFQLALRVRNIAEHACTPTGPGDPFSHARTTHAGWIERALLAPYYVNYHCEHHLFMGVPCYRLPLIHRLLLDRGYGPRMVTADGYFSVLQQVTQPKPA